MDVLEHLLAAPVPDGAFTMTRWLARLRVAPTQDRSIDRALWAGFEADRLGFAFVGGYQAALDRLLGPERAPTSRRFSLAATESGGAHPKAIATRLTERDGSLSLSGEKTFATLASVADEILVVASRGQGADGKNNLSLVRVRPDAPGVTMVDRDPTPFAPEVPHARLTLSDVTVEAGDVLPGDGYTAWLKPFRTIEDTHVLAAALGHVIRTARAHRFDRAVVEGAFAAVLGLRHVARLKPLDPKAHVALAGLFAQVRRLISEHDSEWDKADAETRDRWRRDIGLLVVAEMARSKRTEAAWKALSPESAMLGRP